MKNKMLKILVYSMFFLIGFLFANFLNYYMVYGLEAPLSKSIGYFGFVSKDTPTDFIKEDQIMVYSDKIVIQVENASISRYAPTGSMEPVLNEYTNGIRVVPKEDSEINVGDIITFKQNNMLIVHRVIDKSTDNSGSYFITKGDNNEISDGKIRFVDIKYKTIGILW